jgi:hypothetical protein
VVGFLQSDDGTVLKPVLERKGLREVDVYQKMFDPNCTDSVLCNLRAFVPKFIGLWSTPVHPGRKFCLCVHFIAKVYS